MKWIALTALAATLVAGSSEASAALTAYYTLDNTSTGLQNGGTDGSTSNLSLFSGSTAATSVSGIIGDALRFGGSTAYYTASAGNAAADLSNYPFTFSIWVSNVVDDTNVDTAISITATASSNRYYGLGVSEGEAAQLERRNTDSILTTVGSSLTGTTWRNIVGVFHSDSLVTVYVDGKSTGPAAVTAVTFNDFSNALVLGGIIRSNTNHIARYNGDLDDAGLFSEALGASDVALINGLGKTGGIGLDQLDEAQLLNAASVGATATIGGTLWQRVDSLGGAIGDFGGTVSGGDAYIITSANGDGIQVVPEPATLGLLSLTGLMLMSRRRTVRR